MKPEQNRPGNSWVCKYLLTMVNNVHFRAVRTALQQTPYPGAKRFFRDVKELRKTTLYMNSSSPCTSVAGTPLEMIRQCKALATDLIISLWLSVQHWQRSCPGSSHAIFLDIFCFCDRVRADFGRCVFRWLSRAGCATRFACASSRSRESPSGRKFRQASTLPMSRFGLWIPASACCGMT